MKICTKCDETKDDCEFYKCGRNKNKLASWCKKCTQGNKVKWRLENRVKYLSSLKSYNNRRRSNPEIRERDKKYSKLFGQTPSGRFMHIRAGAKSRGLAFELTKEEFMSFWGKECHYCGEKIDGVGIDRIDSSKGYAIQNCVPCCRLCNTMKMAMEKDQFISRCEMIVRNSKAKI